MKKTILYSLSILALAAMSAGCIRIKPGSGKKDYGDMVNRPIQVDSTFSAIETYAITDVEYTEGPLEIELTAPEKIMQDIEVKVENGTLKIDMKENETNLGLIRSKIVISAPAVNTFKTTGMGDITIKGLNTKDVTLETYGTGDINLETAKCTKLTATSTGTGDIDIAHLSCVIGEFTTNGTGDITVKRLVADKISGTTTGTGDLSISGECKESNLTSTGIGKVKDRGLEIIKDTEE